MAEKRERLDVVCDILSAVLKNNNKIGPTRLIQLSNLSPAMFKEYTCELINQGLLKEIFVKNKKFFELGDKGYKFLEQYRAFRNFVEELGL